MISVSLRDDISNTCLACSLEVRIVGQTWPRGSDVDGSAPVIKSREHLIMASPHSISAFASPSDGRNLKSALEIFCNFNCRSGYLLTTGLGSPISLIPKPSWDREDVEIGGVIVIIPGL